ncbi:MAG TPA: hypothetical protein VFO70_00535 [Chitinophagaceae bacterium]|nr:hypothetical protein [Chitinophagaceae bacterium]
MKKFIDILGILLPALIILLGIIRLFVKNTKGYYSVIMLLAVLLLFLGIFRYYAFPDKQSSHSGTKPPPLAVSKHSNAFNQSVNAILLTYNKLTDAFAANELTDINRSGNEVKLALDSLKIEELKVDPLIYETALQPYQNAGIAANLLISESTLPKKREALNSLSNELFALLSTVRYDLEKLFWLECVNAFGEDKPGNWLSKTEQSSNPYGQKDCSEVKTTINFMPADPTKNQ